MSVGRLGGWCLRFLACGRWGRVREERGRVGKSADKCAKEKERERARKRVEEM